MDDILKSEIFIVVYEKKDGVSFEEFGGLFRQTHGYYLNLSKHGYSSLSSLLNDMKDLVEIKVTKGHQIIRCKSPSRHHMVVSHGNNEQVSGLSSGLPSSGPSPDPVVRKTDQAQPTQNHVKQVNSTNSATGQKAKEKPKHTCSTPAKNTAPAVNHKKSPLPVKWGIRSNEKTAADKTSKEKPKPICNIPAKNTAPAVNHKNSPLPVKWGIRSNEKTAAGKTSKENPKPICNIPAKNTAPAVNHKNSLQPVKCGFSSNKKTATKNKATNSCSVSQQVNSTNFVTGKTSKEEPKPTWSTPAKNINPAVNPKNSPQLVKCGFLSNEKTATKTETTNSLSGLPISKPLLASPAGNVAATSGATRTSGATTKTNLTHLQNNRPVKTGAIENKVFSTSGPNKNAGLLPTPKMPVKSSPFDFNYNLQIAQPIMSYASVCAQNLNNNHFNRNGQQYTPNNVRFNVGNRVNSANVTQSHSRAQPRPPIQPSSVIKENIQGLLIEHANGLSIFQLQKIYLFKYRQPLKFRGSATLKQLLMELKDVVKTEGVGVQMLVFPAPAENIQVTAAGGDHDVALHVDLSLLTEKDSIKEVVLNPHSVDSLTTQYDELQEATQLPFNDGQILASGPYQIDPMEGHITEVVKTENTQPIMQNMQRIEHISSNARHEESPEEVLSVPASDAGVLPNQINDNLHHKTPQLVQMQPTEFPELQQREDFQTAKNCDLTEFPPSHPTDNLKTETVLVQTEKPSSIQKDNSKIRKTVEQAEHLPLNTEEKAPNSQITNNRNVVLKPAFNEKTPDANIIKKTSQQETNLSPPTSDLGRGENTHGHYVHDTERAKHTPSHVHKGPDTLQSETKQNKSTLQTKQFDEFTSSEMIPHNSLLTSRTREEISDPFQNIPMQPSISAAQNELPNNLDCITDQEDNNKTWQTSQEAACCIL